jgi:hypothetical protein
MQQLGRVFISSAFRDMMDLRDAAAEALKLAGMESVPAEDHVAQTGPVRDTLACEIRHYDTYVGIFDKNRGTVPPGSVRAITEEEFLLARDLGFRCLVFLSRRDRSKRDPGLNEFLDAEVTEYRSGVWRGITRMTPPCAARSWPASPRCVRGWSCGSRRAWTASRPASFCAAWLRPGPERPLRPRTCSGKRNRIGS